MKPIIISVLSGFVGGVVAVVALYIFLSSALSDDTSLSISTTQDPIKLTPIIILETEPRPQGYFIRYRNDSKSTAEAAFFVLKAYTKGKLWKQWETSDSYDVGPGDVRESILSIYDESTRGSPDLSAYDVKIESLYATGKR